MPDPKTLQEIAEKTIAFDRAHFADGNDPEVDTLLRHHETLKTDPELITRLVSRYAVALGYFEGYAKTVELDEVLRNNIKHAIGAKSDENLFGALDRIRIEHRQEIATLVKQRDDKTRQWMAAQTALDNEKENHRRTMSELANVQNEATSNRCETIDKLYQLQNRIAMISTRLTGRSARDEATVMIGATISEIVGEQQNIGIVKRPPPPPPPPVAPLAPNELSTEVDDELAQAAADYANERQGHLPALTSDLACAKLAIFEPIKAVDRSLAWCHSARAFAYGARWQLNRMENVAGEDPPNVHELREENEKLRETIEMTAKQGAEWRDRLEALDADKSPIVFRDNDEREYWDSMTFMLARKGDTTSQSVASAADEMVEERRARMPIGTEKEVKPQSTEPSDELLLKAARFANEECRYSEMKDDLENAHNSLLIADATKVRAKWSIAIRSYIAGALGK